MEREIYSTKRKALLINLDQSIYGTFAEIGAGQEVSRWFFRAGGASGTIAKTISAYDKKFSDRIYSRKDGERYVSEERLNLMLEREWQELVELLAPERGTYTRFFVFANTVSTLNYLKNNEAHGWIGLRFQIHPCSEPNTVVLHARFLENDRLLQQNTLGELGVNLIFACFNYYKQPNIFLNSLLDNISSDRVEINMIKMSGPELEYVDNRLLAVQLVKNNMTNVVMFDRKGFVRQSSDILYKKNVVVLRGSFRPITYVGFDMLKTGMSVFKKEVGFDKEKTLLLCEMTLKNLLQDDGQIDERDFLDRVDILCGMGQNVMVTNFREFYKLSEYFSNFNFANLRLIVSTLTLKYIFDRRYYENLKGGLLEAFGKLFKNNTALYIYPSLDNESDKVITLENFRPSNKDDEFIFKYLLCNKKLIEIKTAKLKNLYISSHLVLELIKNRDPMWENMVPVYVKEKIKLKKLFGYE